MFAAAFFAASPSGEIAVRSTVVTPHFEQLKIACRNAARYRRIGHCATTAATTFAVTFIVASVINLIEPLAHAAVAATLATAGVAWVTRADLIRLIGNLESHAQIPETLSTALRLDERSDPAFRDSILAHANAKASGVSAATVRSCFPVPWRGMTTGGLLLAASLSFTLWQGGVASPVTGSTGRPVDDDLTRLTSVAPDDAAPAARLDRNTMSGKTLPTTDDRRAGDLERAADRRNGASADGTASAATDAEHPPAPPLNASEAVARPTDPLGFGGAGLAASPGPGSSFESVNRYGTNSYADNLIADSVSAARNPALAEPQMSSVPTRSRDLVRAYFGLQSGRASR